MKKNKVIKIVSGIVIVLNLIAGAYVLNEATRESEYEYMHVYSNDSSMTLKDVFTNEVLAHKNPEGYTLSPNAKKSDEDTNFLGCLLIERKGPGIIERTVNNVASLVKRR